jgi:hypothetical protein
MGIHEVRGLESKTSSDSLGNRESTAAFAPGSKRSRKAIRSRAALTRTEGESCMERQATIAQLAPEFLKPMGITQTALAAKMSVPLQRVNTLINGKRSAGAHLALASPAEALLCATQESNLRPTAPEIYAFRAFRGRKARFGGFGVPFVSRSGGVSA